MGWFLRGHYWTPVKVKKEKKVDDSEELRKIKERYDHLTYNEFCRLPESNDWNIFYTGNSVYEYWVKRLGNTSDSTVIAEKRNIPTDERGGWKVPEYMVDAKCGDCGNDIPPDGNIYFVDNGMKIVCPDCFAEYFFCTGCGNWMKGDKHSVTDLHGESKEVCDECLTKYDTCSDCGKLHPRRYMAYNPHNDAERYCQQCIPNHSTRCHDCDTSLLPWQVQESEGHGYCNYCYSELRNVINGYHAKRKDREFYGDGSYFLGVELEVENHECNIATVDGAAEADAIFGKGFMFFEHDGSLNDGFEMVSPPCTPAYFNGTLLPKYEEAMQYLSNNGFRSHQTDTCGLHVHVSNEAFGEDSATQEKNLVKMLFAYEKYWDDIVKLSRRRSGDIDQWAKRYGEKDEDEWVDLISSKGGYYGRYFAVNLTNERTVEFRIFKGTLNIKTFKATIDFVTGLIEACNNQSIQDIHDQPSLAGFMDTFASEELVAYMSERGL